MPFSMQQMIMMMLEQRAQSNPMFAQLLSLAKKNDTKGIENMVRGIVESQGRDFDKEFDAFKRR